MGGMGPNIVETLALLQELKPASLSNGPPRDSDSNRIDPNVKHDSISHMPAISN